MRRVHHVHSERVYLAGFGTAGTFALALGLTRPEWFAGLAAFGTRMPEVSHLLSRLDEIRGLRVFLGAGQRDRTVPTAEVSRVSRLLQSAGLRVCHRLYESGHELTRAMLVELDRWVMKDLWEPASV
jgi:phospholipase/carboxylesterase